MEKTTLGLLERASQWLSSYGGPYILQNHLNLRRELLFHLNRKPSSSSNNQIEELTTCKINVTWQISETWKGDQGGERGRQRDLRKDSIETLFPRVRPGKHKLWRYGKPLFEMCWFYMGIAQLALDPPLPPLSNGQTWKKGAPNHPGKPLHPGQIWKKKCPKPSWQAFTTTPPFRQCPYGNNTFQKGASLIHPPSPGI